MGRNGQPCREQPAKMAIRIGCELSSFHSAATKLCEFGYIERSKSSTDGRRTEYRVIYINELDSQGIGARTPDEKKKIAPLKDKNELSVEKFTHPEKGSQTPATTGDVTTSLINGIYSENPEYTFRGQQSKNEYEQAGKKPDLLNEIANQYGWERAAFLNPEQLEYLEQKAFEGSLHVADIKQALLDAESGSNSLSRCSET